MGDADMAGWNWWFGGFAEAGFPDEVVGYGCGGEEGVWKELFGGGHDVADCFSIGLPGDGAQRPKGARIKRTFM